MAFVLAVTTAFYFGGLKTALTVSILCAMEISLSFDNAIVNSKVLEHWDAKWRNIFLYFGIFVAVGLMRLAFPILIVSGFAHISIPTTVNIALTNHTLYAAKLTEVHPQVSAFGGGFLAMLGLGYFFDAEKDSHWLGPIEGLLAKFGSFEYISAALTLVGLGTVSLFMVEPDRYSFLLSGVVGIVMFAMTRGLAQMTSAGGKIIQQGIFGFIYLEVMDASFSFDGVLGAFALTNEIVWITAALGVGALAVRELTVLATDRGTLTEFPYLEHGAFWAILVLAITMLLGPVVELPETVKGLSGIALIGAAFITSLVVNKRALADTVAA